MSVYLLQLLLHHLLLLLLFFSQCSDCSFFFISEKLTKLLKLLLNMMLCVLSLRLKLNHIHFNHLIQHLTLSMVLVKHLDTLNISLHRLLYYYCCKIVIIENVFIFLCTTVYPKCFTIIHHSFYKKCHGIFNDYRESGPQFLHLIRRMVLFLRYSVPVTLLGC